MMKDRDGISRHAPKGVSYPAPLFSLAGKRLTALDGLRGMAIVPVVIYHLAAQLHGQVTEYSDQVFLRVCQAGWIGVDLFFVLSGFLITGILLETRSSSNYFTSFYGRRTLRIFPAYYATLFVLLLVVPTFSGLLPASLRDMSHKMAEYQAWFWCYAANWLFTMQGGFGDVPGGYFWSLAVEEQFYLAWPIVVLWLGRDRLARFILVILPLSIVCRVVFVANGVSPSSVYTATFTHLDGLFAGALLAVAVRTGEITTAKRRLLGLGAAISATILVVGGVWMSGFRFWDPWIASIGYSLLAVCFAYMLLMAITARPGSLLQRLFDNLVLRSCGKYSYAMYLLHVPTGYLVEKVIFSPARHPFGHTLLPSILLFIVLGLVICWLAAVVSWNLFEKHFLKLKDFFPYESPALST